MKISLIKPSLSSLFGADSLDVAQLSGHKIITENNSLANLTLWKLVIIFKVVWIVLLMLLGGHLHHLITYDRLRLRETSSHHHGVPHHSRLLLIGLAVQWTRNERRRILTELHSHVLNTA
jgi:hypothetical protein